MKQSLKSALQNHYQQQQLSADQLDQLLQLQLNAQPAKTRRRSRWALGAGLCLAIVLGWRLLLVTPELGQPQQIADEVVYNHLNLKPLEVKGANFTEISRYFSKLQFQPVRSERVSLSGLAGARYCSIKTIPAAQYRLVDARGQAQTWYQVAYNAKAFGDIPNFDLGEPPLLRYSKGIGVKIWQEKGVLFALTISHE